MQRLGLNTVRVYNLDPRLNHDLCASIFNRVGIYMLLDVNSPLAGESLNRGQPSESYNAEYLTRIFGVVEAFKDYPNTLAFFGGNEVINDGLSAAIVPPYLRAVQRDLKNYIAKHASRPIPVGYSAADVREALGSTWQYLQCAINGDAGDASRADFFGLNSYSWCGAAADFQSAGYDQLVAQFANTSIPVFFSEYGCNAERPRVFNEVAALYGPLMTAVLSGGLVYEYSMEESNFGLVAINADGSAQLQADYDHLQQQYGQLDLARLTASNGTATSAQPPTCDSRLINYPPFNTSFTLPAVPAGGQDLIEHGVPNANRGKIVDVTKTQVSQTVKDSSGVVMQGLSVKLLPDDQSNVPASVSSMTTASATATATSSAASATTTKKGAAARMCTSGWMGMTRWMMPVVVFLAV
ncbi:MAG: hypothetical protein M1826_003049 [Phylliscum demangeonii]|nr:MAG: hypothetical protein M1826_003049 [Phylliscum demangeonii]